MITQTDMMRVMNEEQLGAPSTATDDTPELAGFRKQFQKDVAGGHELEMPFDWDDDDSEQANENPNHDARGEFATADDAGGAPAKLSPMANGFREDENRDEKGRWANDLAAGGFGANGSYNRTQRNVLKDMEKKQLEALKSGAAPAGVRYDADLTGEPLPPNTIKNHLSMLAQMAHSHPSTDGMKYCGTPDFVLQEGKEFKVPATPPKIALMTPKECFKNSATMAVMERGGSGKYDYVEGYTMDRLLPFPIDHAWLADKQTGEVVDPTLGWRPKAQYFGVKFDKPFVMKKLVQNGHYGLFSDGVMGCPLVLGKDKDYKYAH